MAKSRETGNCKPPRYCPDRNNRRVLRGVSFSLQKKIWIAWGFCCPGAAAKQILPTIRRSPVRAEAATGQRAACFRFLHAARKRGGSKVMAQTGRRKIDCFFAVPAQRRNPLR